MNAQLKSQFARWLESTPLAGANADYLEHYYELYLQNPHELPAQWREYFDRLVGEQKLEQPEVSRTQAKQAMRAMQHSGAGSAHTSAALPAPAGSDDAEKQIRVLQLINAYRFMGHRVSNVNPLEYKDPETIADLELATHYLSQEDLNREFDSGSLFGLGRAKLSKILDVLKTTYCGSVGAEYMHITDTKEKRWIQNYFETVHGQLPVTDDVKLRLLQQLVAAEGLERYLHTKYVGQKRFSLEGAENLIPMIHELIMRAGSQGVQEVTLGMAHRGRLNVLINIMGKTSSELFMEFEGKTPDDFMGSGDVKYHKGFSTDYMTPGGATHITLAFNPSHLEIVGPVVEGSVRARQDRRNDTEGREVIPVLVHGDAAFAGQGVVMETLNMSQSRGFSTKGTVHIVVNNQIGFTTSNQEDARSTLYCTDVAKMVSAPIFHVNGDDPQAVLFVTQMALDYRMTFYKDVVIDLVCYRRHGHSEADEPMATQPLMYQAIRNKPTSLEGYALSLIEQNVLTPQRFDEMKNSYRDRLDRGECVVNEVIEVDQATYPFAEDWARYNGSSCKIEILTKVDKSVLQDLHARLRVVPEGFSLHPNVERIMKMRDKMAAGEYPVDWGFAETMAYASLLQQGYAVRLSGQDAGRGTFFHRHAVLHDQATGEAYVPLRELMPNQPRFLVINSLLSEEAVLAFEYGYSTTDPSTLTLWEAQFGDFANNAQVVIDQFISAGEQKWNRLSGLVMLLPHGFEGQGPEHSSARLERYLQLCAEHNITVCVPSTAAQIFHLLRRQILQTCRKPLVVMAPKSLLRHKEASSPLSDLYEGIFEKVKINSLGDDPAKITRVIMCSGKVFYDIYNRVLEEERHDVAVIRIEQLYPFPTSDLKNIITRLPSVRSYVWCQEEPKNQGAWYSSQHNMLAAIGRDKKLIYAGRARSAAPAVGLYSLHIKQLQDFLAEALGSPA